MTKPKPSSGFGFAICGYRCRILAIPLPVSLFSGAFRRAENRIVYGLASLLLRPGTTASKVYAVLAAVSDSTRFQFGHVNLVQL